jgi:hypothetical protein
MHFHDSVIVFERGRREKPFARSRGTSYFDVRDGGGQAGQGGQGSSV